MNSILYNTKTGVKFGIGKLPGRKQSCFYFTKEDDTVIVPAAYISKTLLAEAEDLWCRLLDGIPVKEEE